MVEATIAIENVEVESFNGNEQRQLKESIASALGVDPLDVNLVSMKAFVQTKVEVQATAETLGDAALEELAGTMADRLDLPRADVTVFVQSASNTPGTAKRRRLLQSRTLALSIKVAAKHEGVQGALVQSLSNVTLLEEVVETCESVDSLEGVLETAGPTLEVEFEVAQAAISAISSQPNSFTLKMEELGWDGVTLDTAASTMELTGVSSESEEGSKDAFYEEESGAAHIGSHAVLQLLVGFGALMMLVI